MSLVQYSWWQEVFGVPWVPLLLQYGVYLFLANDYHSLLGARIMQGFGTGPFEMLVPSSIGDMFVH